MGDLAPRRAGDALLPPRDHDVRAAQNEHWITESLEYSLQPTSQRDWQQRKLSLLDRAQRAAIYAFALCKGEPTGAGAWARVYEAEREGERADWFQHFNPA